MEISPDTMDPVLQDGTVQARLRGWLYYEYSKLCSTTYVTVAVLY